MTDTTDLSKLSDDEIMQMLEAGKNPPKKVSGADMADDDPNKPGMIKSALRGAAQGVSFGFADEGVGLIHGIGSMLSGGSFGAGYDKAVSEYRENDRIAKEANPLSSLAGELAGGVGTGLGLARGGLTLARAGQGLLRGATAGAVEGAGYGALQGAGTAEGGLSERLGGAAEGAQGGALFGAAVPTVARMISGGATRAVTPFQVSPERQAAVDALARENVPVSAGQRSGNKMLQYGESFLGDAPGAGGQATAFAERQGEAFTDAAMRRHGGAGRATPDNIDDSFRRVGQDFTDLSARNTLQADPTLGRDIGRTLRAYDLVLPSDQREIIGRNAADIVQRLSQGGGQMPGDMYQTLRSRLTQAVQGARGNDGNLADAFRGLRDALDNAMERSIQPGDAGAWNTARRQYGNLKDVARAAGGAGAGTAEGLISPQALRASVAGGKNREAYARGRGDLSELTHAGNAVMAPLPNSGTAQRNMLTGMTSGGAGAGVALGDPILAAAVALGPGVVGRALWSGPVQRYLSNGVITPAARRALEARLRTATQGGGQAVRAQMPKASAEDEWQ